MQKLFIDIETFSSIDLKTAGLNKYTTAEDFEIMLIGYAVDDGPVKVLDLTELDETAEEYQSFLDLLVDSSIKKIAHNAMFERVSFKRIGIDIPADEWFCTMVKAAYVGLPFSLAQVAKALEIKNQKLDTGTALIRYFSIPCKPTKTNGQRTRNYPRHARDKWKAFVEYLIADVEACREVFEELETYEFPKVDQELYFLDQKINDRGIAVDLDFVQAAINVATQNTDKIREEMVKLTQLANPNSLAQLKSWLSKRLNRQITALTKTDVDQLLKETDDQAVRKVLRNRQELGKTSVAKYEAMVNSEIDGRIKGLFQYYGANATGRWAGRLVQVHNLPRNYLRHLDFIREAVKDNDYDLLDLSFDNLSNILSQLIRTAFVPKDNHLLVVSDFSAIESRVVSWYAGEDWRLEVFKTHGKIYEATASKMFGIPFDDIDKGSKYRQQGKVAELAFGFGGSVGAISQMDINNEIPDDDKPNLVRMWRKANPKIVQLWKEVENTAIEAIENRRQLKLELPLTTLRIGYYEQTLYIILPSGHILNYWRPKLETNKFGGVGITYSSLKNGGWVRVDTYGGKLVENIVQATARDLLGNSMLRIDQAGLDIIMHVHDEVVVEAYYSETEQVYNELIDIMSEPVNWAPGLPLAAAGFISKYYKKD